MLPEHSVGIYSLWNVTCTAVNLLHVYASDPSINIYYYCSLYPLDFLTYTRSFCKAQIYTFTFKDQCE